MNTSEQSPATPATTASEQAINATQAKDLVSAIESYGKNILALSRMVDSVPTGSELSLMIRGRPVRISRRTIVNLQSQLSQEFKKLSSMITQLTRKRKRTTRQGLGPSTYATNELLDFVRGADFGPSYYIEGAVNGQGGQCVQGPPLRDQLPFLLENGLAASKLFPVLMSIYQRHHGMQDPNRGTIYRATPEMIRFFPNTFNELTARNQQNPRRKKADKIDVQDGLATKVGQDIIIPPFSPDMMMFYDFQRMITFNSYKKAQLDAEARAFAEDPNTRAILEQEFTVVAQTLECLKAQQKAQQEAASPARRRRRTTRQTSPRGPLPAVQGFQQVLPNIQQASPVNSLGSQRSTGSLGSNNSQGASPTRAALPNIVGSVNRGFTGLPQQQPGIYDEEDQ